MRYFKFILYIVSVLSFNSAFGQIHIYDRYASRPDLEVAYLQNVPLDSAITVNATLIIARDSAAWEWLVTEFHIGPSFFPDNVRSLRSTLRNKYDPTQDKSTDILDCCIIFVNSSRKSLSIFQYETIDQFNSIVSFSFKKFIHEKK